jgi:hypothetical protein
MHGQKLHDAEPERVDDVVETPGHVAERAGRRDHRIAQPVQFAFFGLNRDGAKVRVQRGAELAHEGRVHRIGARRMGGLHFDAHVVARRPFGDLGPLREKAGLAGEHADLGERDTDGKVARGHLAHRHVVPVAREHRLAGLGTGDDLFAANGRQSQIGAKDGPPFAR